MDKSLIVKTKEVISASRRKAVKSEMFQKMLDDNKVIHAYLDGEISKEQLDSKGIKFVKSL